MTKWARGVTLTPEERAGMYERISRVRDRVIVVPQGVALPAAPPMPAAKTIADRARLPQEAPVRPQGDPNRAAHLRKLAESLTGEIVRKRNCHANANLTRKRMEEQRSAFREADLLEQEQALLYALADMHEIACEGGAAVPLYVAGVRTKVQAQFLVRCVCGKRTAHYPEREVYTWEWGETILPRHGSDLNKIGITNREEYIEARTFVEDIISRASYGELKLEREFQAREKELALAKIEGFFPTPPALVERLIHLADLIKHDTILEPSAGSGSIADAVRKARPEAELHCCEIHYSLRKLLQDKGHNVVAENFLEFNPAIGYYSTIIMNPPFEHGQDCDHIRNAYNLLADGGRVVAVMSRGSWHRSGRKYEQWHDWFSQVGGRMIEVEEGAFKESLRATGVNVCLVCITKNIVR